MSRFLQMTHNTSAFPHTHACTSSKTRVSKVHKNSSVWTKLLAFTRTLACCFLFQCPKKMVRYLDGRVVSTKGERFTEVKKEEDEEMKKTYVNLKPARKYRFHWRRPKAGWAVILVTTVIVSAIILIDSCLHSANFMYGDAKLLKNLQESETFALDIQMNQLVLWLWLHLTLLNVDVLPTAFHRFSLHCLGMNLIFLFLLHQRSKLSVAGSCLWI